MAKLRDMIFQDVYMGKVVEIITTDAGGSNVTGKVDATGTHPDGKYLVRIEDHWFFQDDCKAA